MKANFLNASKIKSKSGKPFYRISCSYTDRIGIVYHTFLCNEQYADKLFDNKDNIHVGFDKRNGFEPFLYIPKGSGIDYAPNQIDNDIITDENIPF